MKRIIIFSIFLLAANIEYCSSKTSITYIADKRTVMVDNVTLKGEPKVNSTKYYGTSREGNFDDGPVISYVGWIISGEITTLASDAKLDSLLKNKAKFDMVFIDPKNPNHGIINYSKCWLTGHKISGKLHTYAFRATDCR
jgi:hypothetical protein